MTTSFQQVDGERGRYLRSLWVPNQYDEVVATDLMRIVAATESLLKRHGLRLAVRPDTLFQALVDFIQARLEKPYGYIVGPRRRVTRPTGWSEEDERIWIEWLEREVVTPTLFGASRGIWEEAAGRWREEWLSYLPYYVERSRDILQEIDPRPWGEEDMSGATATGDEEWRR